MALEIIFQAAAINLQPSQTQLGNTHFSLTITGFQLVSHIQNNGQVNVTWLVAKITSGLKKKQDGGSKNLT